MGSTPAALEATTNVSAEALDRVTEENHRRANDVTLLTREVASRDKHFECELELPLNMPWPTVIIRAHGTTKTQAAQGILIVPVHREGD
jgi:hypothetical protein